MKARFSSVRRKGIFIFLILALLFSIPANYPRPVFAGYGANGRNSYPSGKIGDSDTPIPELTPTPTAEAPASMVFDPGSVSITLIFQTILEWLMGKSLTDVFEDARLTDEQREQIASLTGESNPLNLANNFCTQIRSGDFARMAQSVRESNREDGGGGLSPAILMDFFEQLGAFCPNSADLPDSPGPIE